MDRTLIALLGLLTGACGGGAAGDGGPPADAAAAPRDAASADAPQAGPAPLGASFDPAGGSYRFRVRSAHATRIALELFAQPVDDPRLERVAERAPGSDVWAVDVPAADLAAAGIAGTGYYGYRAWGPNWPYDPSWSPGSSAGFAADVDGQGNRFDPNKLLTDPYARELSHDPITPQNGDASIYAVGATNRAKDSARLAPKGIVLDRAPLDTGAKPARALTDDVIYEVHLRGLTENDPSADPKCRGTYAAAAAKAPALAALGVTAVELLPIFETQNDANDLQMSTYGQNYWGYSTLGFFAPDRRYACDQTPGGPTRELAAMVKALHAAGIKVLLDVVYNHTAEGGGGALHSFRGLDNASYYELGANPATFYDDTGIGANFNVADPIAHDLVLDSLAYFSDELGVDGFRFDLASVVGNTCTAGCYKFDPGAGGLLAQIAQRLPGAPLIAEPWGVGNGTYQLGNFPPGWSEWNGQFRDGVRTAQNKLGVTATTPRQLSGWVAGSPGLFDHAGRTPSATINYLVSHDGFTLRDLYSCNAADNGQPWPYGPSGGGTADNISWDYGGTTSRQQHAERTGLALLFTSAGVPMLTGGDEMGRTIRCNNNPYDLDSIGNWLDWPSADPARIAFAQEMIALRAAHAALRPTGWWSGTDHNGDGLSDVTWLRPDGGEADGAYLGSGANRFFAFRLDATEAGETAARSIVVAYNEDAAAATFTLPALSGAAWYVAADTGAPIAGASYVAAPGAEPMVGGASYPLAERTVVVLVEK
jgi:glycogen operon protein